MEVRLPYVPADIPYQRKTEPMSCYERKLLKDINCFDVSLLIPGDISRFRATLEVENVFSIIK